MNRMNHLIRTATLLVLSVVLLVAAVPAGVADTTPHVVTLEIRLVQAPRADVNQLLPNTGYTVTEDALRQIDDWVARKKATILAQPRISTISGNAAQIRSVRELIYPTDYEPPPARDNAKSSPPIPGAFKTRELGVLFNVTPTVGADPQWINITLVPELSQLSAHGFVQHEANLRGGRSTGISTPDIHSWNLTTSIVLKSGSTVVLGVHDPVSEGVAKASENVVVVLLSAAVHSLQ